MSTHQEELPDRRPDEIKTIEKNGYPEPAPRVAAEDLRFVVRESLKLGLRMISEIDRALRALTR
ncbi:hypothetical protein [Chlorobium sp. N1]|uniref:hypothetical protein n=1 Tax=Chlorobium sp. N1 TaxID=2491138 RepID=UPI00103A708F|nr:hypothetical protein [Chlorobium sp. N1]TCD48585.1 hypothetical protein E0L29_01525 [Chlorobium sp. N1]